MRPSLEDVPTPSKAAVARECWRECVQSCPRTSSDMYRKAAIPIKGECCRLFCTVKSSAHAGCMTSLLLQYDGRVDVKSLSFGARIYGLLQPWGLQKASSQASRRNTYISTQATPTCVEVGTACNSVRLLIPSVMSRLMKTGDSSMISVSTGPKAVQPKPAKMTLKAPLVPRTQRPVMGVHSDRDCVYTNALQTIRCAAPQAVASVFTLHPPCHESRATPA